MTIINVRSPYIVSIGDYGGTQTGSKVELSIYKKGETPPTLGTGYYSLSKKIVSATQRETRYNISNYVKEFFNHTNLSGIGSNPSDASLGDWIFVDVKLSWINGGTSTVISNTTYVALDGYTEYRKGANQTFGGLQMYSLVYDYYKRNVKQGSLKSFLLLAEVPSAGNKVDVVYTTTYLGLPYSVTRPVILATDPRGIYNKKIRLSIDSTFPEFIGNETSVQTKWYASTTVNLGLELIVNVIEECKYDPVEITYINKRGGWEVLPFFKARRDSISVKGTDYKLTQNDLSYDPTIGQFQTFNKNGKQTVKLNTGWVEEYYSEFIKELLLSETVVLDYYGLSFPVTVKTSSSDLKTTLKDKNINYEIEFEYAFNLINDAV